LTTVKLSMRNSMSRSPVPERTRLNTVPLTLVVGVSLGGVGVGVGVGVGSGVGAGVLTVGPGCVGEVGVSSFPHAAIGRIEPSNSARNV
jgi:hypothetical protein